MMAASLPAAHEWDLWSTRARLVVTEPSTLTAALRLAIAHLTEVDLVASRFRADSEILTLEPDEDGSTAVSPLLADLLRAALTVARQTDGAVDLTVGGTLVDLGYDRDIRLLAQPGRPRAVVGAVRPVPGWRSVRLDGDRLHLPAGLQLDLGATAKAYAADHVAALVAHRLDTGVLVSLGGDIATAGPSPRGGWQIRVQDTDADRAALVAIPGGSAMATSSTVRRTWRRNGETHDLHHIVDPVRARPAAAGLAQRHRGRRHLRAGERRLDGDPGQRTGRARLAGAPGPARSPRRPGRGRPPGRRLAGRRRGLSGQRAQRMDGRDHG